MIGIRPFALALFVAALASLSACSDDSESGTGGSAASQNGDARSPNGMRPINEAISPGSSKVVQLEGFVEPKIAKKWAWESVVDPELAPNMDWSFEDKLAASVDWSADVLVVVNGEPITKDDLEGWLYLTRGSFASDAYFEYLLAKDWRKRMGLPALEDLPRERSLKFAEELLTANGVKSEEERKTLMRRGFFNTYVAKNGYAYRVEMFRNLIEGDFSVDSVPEDFKPYYQEIADLATARSILSDAVSGENPPRAYLDLPAALGSILAVERALHLYTRFDHDDGLGGVATVVYGHNITDDRSFGAPWDSGGELVPVTIDELRANVPVEWSLGERWIGLRSLAATRLVEKALRADDATKWPDDKTRWINYWEGVTQLFAQGITYERYLTQSWEAPSKFDTRVWKQLQDYDRVTLEDELVDREKMQAFVDGNRWNLEKWTFACSVVFEPFIDPVTGVTRGPDAEQAALDRIRQRKRDMQRAKDFERFAFRAWDEAPELPEGARESYANAYNGLKERHGRLTGKRSDFELGLPEFLIDRWMRGTSVVETIVKMEPGEVRGPVKGPHGWYLIRMHSGRANGPRKELQQLGRTPYLHYAEYHFLNRVADALRSAEISTST